MKQINNYRNTIAGIVMVFAFLFSFCIADYTILWLTKNELYATIGGLASIIIILIGFSMDFWVKVSYRQGKELEWDLKPKGIDPTKSVYPTIEDDAQIHYSEGHAEAINPINKEKDEKSE